MPRVEAITANTVGRIKRMWLKNNQRGPRGKTVKQTLFNNL